MKLRLFLLCLLPLLALMPGCGNAQPTPTAANPPSNPAPRSMTRVLVIGGDWKTQEWYQDVWNREKKPMRGRFIAAQVEKAAPGKFAFTHMTSYEGLQYVDANYLSQFDVLLLGDVMGFSLPPRFFDGLQNFIKNGGGFGYLASWKWHTAMMDDSPLEAVLPARFGVDNSQDDWTGFNYRVQPTPFKAQVTSTSHPITRNLNWDGAPNLDAAFKIAPKQGAQVLLQTPGGTPILAAWEHDGGRAVLSASIFSNDELSGNFAQNWSDFGRYYAQLLSWLGAKSNAKTTPLKTMAGAVEVTIDATKALNAVGARTFGIHASHDDPNLAPLKDQALASFQKLNLNGAFSRVRDDDFENANDDNDPNHFNWSGFNFKKIDAELAEIKRLNLEPIFLVTAFRYGNPKWLYADGSSIQNPSDKYVAEVAEQCAAIVEHINGGKGGSPNYTPNLEYLEVGNEPDINAKTIDGFIKIFKAVAARIHRDYPGVKVGAMGGYEIPYIYQFMEAAGDDVDWISRHPYGWTGEMLFQKQDEYAAWRKERGLKPVDFIITEWDFWIQGKPKFDYMMRRYFEAVKRENLAGTLHYRLGQYDEGGYMFGVLWAGWGKEKGGGEKGAPMHDAYDALWAFRDFRGTRAPAQVRTPATPGLEKHLLVEAARDGDKLNVVLYFDRGADGTGWKDFTRGVHVNKARVNLKVSLPPSKATRVLTLSRATGEGFEVLPEKISVPANATSFSHTLEIEPNTALSCTLQ